MKYAITLLLLIFSHIAFAQQVGSKVSILAEDGKTYYGTIVEKQNDKYKVKYDGHEFEAWLTADQFKLLEENQPVKPADIPLDTVVNNSNGAPVETSAPKGMTRTDSIQLAVKAAAEVLQKILTVKRDTVTIVVGNVEYDNAELVLLRENLKKAKGVKSVGMRYSASTAVLEVACKGKATDIWDGVPASNRSRFRLVEAGDNNLKLVLR